MFHIYIERTGNSILLINAICYFLFKLSRELNNFTHIIYFWYHSCCASLYEYCYSVIHSTICRPSSEICLLQLQWSTLHFVGLRFSEYGLILHVFHVLCYASWPAQLRQRMHVVNVIPTFSTIFQGMIFKDFCWFSSYKIHRTDCLVYCHLYRVVKAVCIHINWQVSLCIMVVLLATRWIICFKNDVF